MRFVILKVGNPLNEDIPCIVSRGPLYVIVRLPGLWDWTDQPGSINLVAAILLGAQTFNFMSLQGVRPAKNTIQRLNTKTL